MISSMILWPTFLLDCGYSIARKYVLVKRKEAFFKFKFSNFKASQLLLFSICQKKQGVRKLENDPENAEAG